MNKKTTVLFDVVIIVITLFSLQTTWLLVQSTIEPLFHASGNMTQVSVNTTVPGTNFNYFFPILLIIGAFLNVRGKRYKMAFVALAGLLSITYNQIV